MPFVAFYFNTVESPPKPTQPDHRKPAKPTHIRVTSRLAWKIGVPEGHPAIPEKEVHILDPSTLRPPVRASTSRRAGTTPDSSIDASDDIATVVLSTSEEDSGSTHSDSQQRPEPVWPFFDIFSSRKPLHVQQLPPSITKGFGYREKGWNDVPREAVIIPVAAEGDDVPVAIMVVGLNTRRPYDRGTHFIQSRLSNADWMNGVEQRTWIELLHVSLSSTLTATMGREAEMKKAE